MLRVRTRKHEMVLSAAKNGAFAVLVLQNPYMEGEGADMMAAFSMV